MTFQHMWKSYSGSLLAASLLLGASIFSFGLGACTRSAGAENREAPEGEAEAKERKCGEEGEESTPELRDRVVLSPEALSSLKLGYAKAKVRAISPSLEVPAEIVVIPDLRATVGPRVAGRVLAVKVTPGQQVKRGAPLVVLESQFVGQARAQLFSAWARVKVAQKAARRARRLAQKHIVSTGELEAAEGRLRLAWADLLAARTRLKAFGVTAQDRASSKHPARVVLRSPIAGTVVRRAVHVGRWVKPEDVLVEVADLSRLWLQAQVYERDLRHIRVGQPVQVAVRAFPGKVFPGKIAVIGSTLDRATRRAQVRIVLPNPKGLLKPGMFATARIQVARGRKIGPLLTVPQSAIQKVDGHVAVFVRVKPGVFVLHKVHTGARAGRFVEIRNGLKAGDTVVSEGSFLLKGELLKAFLGEDE